jgi:AraC family transcriptional regulator
VEQDVPPNLHGVVNKTIPGGRCAVARHFGSRADISAASYLYEVWLPHSGEELRDFPIFFHYVNVGPNVREHEMITDVYLPLR